MSNKYNPFMDRTDQAKGDVIELEDEFIEKVNTAYAEYMAKYNEIHDVKSLNRLHGKLHDNLALKKTTIRGLLKNYKHSYIDLPAEDLPISLLLDPSNDDEFKKWVREDGTNRFVLTKYIITSDEALTLSHMADVQIGKKTSSGEEMLLPYAKRLIDISNGKFPEFVEVSNKA